MTTNNSTATQKNNFNYLIPCSSKPENRKSHRIIEFWNITNNESSSESSENEIEKVDLRSLSDLAEFDFIIIEPKPRTSFDILTHMAFGDVTVFSACKQFVFGGAFGWLSGYLALKVGKFLAAAVGCTLLLFQIAQFNGLVSVTWTKLRHVLTRTQAKLRQDILTRRHSITSKAQTFLEENFFLTVGYPLGFILTIYL